MFTLDHLTVSEREKLAVACNTSSMYLFQCGKGFRSPSLKLSFKLMRHDNRLTVKGLLYPKQHRDALLAEGRITIRPYAKRTSKKSKARKAQ